MDGESGGVVTAREPCCGDYDSGEKWGGRDELGASLISCSESDSW